MTPQKPIPMREELAELWRFRELLRQMLTRELKVRYKHSVLGFLWSIAPPLLQVVIYTFVFSRAFDVHVPHFPAYMLSGLLPWTFFNIAILDSSQSLLNNFQILRKIYLPREIIPLTSVLSNFVHFLLGWVVFFFLFLLAFRLIPGGGIPLLPTMLLFPVIVLMELLLVTGLAFIFSALNVFYQDVKFILQTLFNLLFFLLPVLYPSDVVFYSTRMRAHSWLYGLYMLNPITMIVTAFRKTLLEPIWPETFNASLKGKPPVPMDWTMFSLSFLLCIFIAWFGYWYFNRRKWQFVERP
jgi:ABC-type polysaccharide/polyol phosphate export permease